MSFLDIKIEKWLKSMEAKADRIIELLEAMAPESTCNACKGFHLPPLGSSCLRVGPEDRTVILDSGHAITVRRAEL